MRSGGYIEVIRGYIKAVCFAGELEPSLPGFFLIWGASEPKSVPDLRIWLNFKWSLVGRPPPPLIQLMIRHEAWSQ